MNVLVCIKRVPDSSGEVVTEDARAVDGRYAGFDQRPRCAVELAIQVAAATGAARACCPRGRRRRRAAAPRWRWAAPPRPTSRPTRRVSAWSTSPGDRGGRPRPERRGRGPDLVLLGNDAADSGDFQVGIRLAYELGWPVVNGVATVSVEDGTVVASGSGPDGHETYRVPARRRHDPRGRRRAALPDRPGRMKAKKVAIEHRTQPPSRWDRRVRLLLPPPQPSDVQILGKGADAAPAVVDLLERLGVLAR